MPAKKKVADLARKAVSSKKAASIKGGDNTNVNRGQAEKRLSDHRNEIRRNWAP